MSTPDDHPTEMGTHRTLDDTVADAILAGRPVPDDLAPVAALVGELRTFGRQPPPSPSPSLASVLAGGPVGEAVLSRVRPDRGSRTAARPEQAQRTGGFLPHALSRLGRNVAAAGLAAKIALGAGVAAASMTGAGAAGVLPGPVQDAVADIVRAVTPFEFPRHTGTAPEGDDGSIPDAPGAPAGGHPAPTDDVPDRIGEPASEAPDAGVAGDPPHTTIGGLPATTAPGATPTTSAPPTDAAPREPGTPPTPQPDATTPEPAPAAPEPTAPKPKPDPEPAGTPTTDAPTPVERQSPETVYDAPAAPPPPETLRP